MKCIINKQLVLSRAPDGPLVASIGAFAKSLTEQGYALFSIRRHVLLAAGFSHWLKRNGVSLQHICSDHTLQYLHYRARQLRPRSEDAPALKHLMDFLRGAELIAAEKISARTLTPVERCTQAYAQYLREARALTEATIINYRPVIDRFLNNNFNSGPVKLSRLTACDVVQFVKNQAPQLHRESAKRLTIALRSFLRYARYRGEVTLDLAAAVPVVANWSMSSIPRAIAEDQARKLLASIDRSTAMGLRDYAIVILLARLGLRSSEVVFLELDDIDWSTGQMIVRGKCGRRSALPVPTDVGEAIAAYLQHGRPTSTNRRVFLRNSAPIRGFRGPSAIACIIARAILRADIQSPTKGAHQFRHALATQMLRHGASLAEIGDVLRHRSPQTTTIYAKVDLKALRTLALPWPGGAR
jgi:site-specific recombinase XerD